MLFFFFFLVPSGSNKIHQTKHRPWATWGFVPQNGSMRAEERDQLEPWAWRSKKNCRRHRRWRNDASARLVLWQALVESPIVLQAWLGQEMHVDLFFLRQLDEQTAQQCARFWLDRRCDATNRGQFFTRNDRDALVASLSPLPNVTHALACKILAGMGPKPSIWWSTDPIYHMIVLVSSCSLVLAHLHLLQALKTKE
jgi:hypothetical protein